jgi:hypothetical protein
MTDGAPEPTFSVTGQRLLSFSALNLADVISPINSLPGKNSYLDALPIPILMQVANEIAPFLAERFDCSLTINAFPERYKSSYITPLIKKAGLDPADTRSYRPISNLSVVSKRLERLVPQQMVDSETSYPTINQHTGHISRPRLQSYVCTYSKLLMRATLQHWFYPIFRPLSIQLTTTFYCAACICHSVLMAPFSTGFGPTSWAGLGALAVDDNYQPASL